MLFGYQDAYSRADYSSAKGIGFGPTYISAVLGAMPSMAIVSIMGRGNGPLVISTPASKSATATKLALSPSETRTPNVVAPAYVHDAIFTRHPADRKARANSIRKWCDSASFWICTNLTAPDDCESLADRTRRISRGSTLQANSALSLSVSARASSARALAAATIPSPASRALFSKCSSPHTPIAISAVAPRRTMLRQAASASYNRPRTLSA